MPLKIRILLIILILPELLMLIMFGIDALAAIPPGELIAPAVGVPVVAETLREPLHSPITQVVADDKYLYVLYNSVHTVQVFTIEGELLYSVGFFGHSNGRSDIAVRDGRLWICDRRHNIYELQEGDFLKFYPQESAEELRRTLPFGRSDLGYELRNGDLWMVTEEEERCILDRPGWADFLQDSDGWLLLAGVMIAIGFLIPGRKASGAEKR